MKKPSIQFISWATLVISFGLALVYRFVPTSAKYFENIGAELVILIPVAIIIMVLLKNQQRSGGNQGGGNNPGGYQGRN